MAQLLVRDIEDELKEQLKARARLNGRSLEAEVRQTLRDSIGGPDPEFWRDLAARGRDHGFSREDIDRMEEIKREPIEPPISFG